MRQIEVRTQPVVPVRPMGREAEVEVLARRTPEMCSDLEDKGR
ncbi:MULTISPECIES: hypothetical protein [unclassified Streptomyces]|nr:hypothetical protein [Streptomyces sp. TSRI0281]